MLKKKLLTIAGVLGILACGACFLPPIHNGPPTPPPPPPIHVPKNIHRVRVIVTDNSIPAQIDTQVMANAVVKYINLLSSSDGIAAHAGGEPADADLAIAIANEDAVLKQVEPSDSSESWLFQFTFSESLKNASGNILKQRTNIPVRVSYTLRAKHADDVWNVPGARDQYGLELSFKATQGLFFR
jgi:hypothetical protein